MAVQLDDDDLVLRTWALAARQAGVQLQQFREPAAFLAALPGLPRETEIYLDARFPDGVRGEDLGLQARALGFSRIFIASGLPRETFARHTWLSGFVGKDPPWLKRG